MVIGATLNDNSAFYLEEFSTMVVKVDNDNG